MEGGRGLASLIRELQGEIKKLENENRALRGQLSRPSSGSELPVPVEPQHGEENSSTAQLRRNVSAPALEAQFKDNMIMTVRRYSISSNTITVPQKGDTTNTSSSSSSSSVFSRPSRADSSSAKETLSSKRSLQQCVNQTRARVKTVTFLLPVEDIYTNRPVLANHVPNRSSQDLNAIMETDS
ncbi:putative coiled-coil domain-containing protein 195 [Astyanax mexicanus]|uniref:Putative coiled-coil domain-containing protein 195 n=1 Tax=Astyanax mexicanus TaxID=7994 RepID=A0A8T2M3D2_ASTMX|nr:putative coiled-coil domain-containing protein 195 [Astyanax mexicanus]